MIEINSLGQLLSLVNSKTQVTVVDFYADWCGPCQQIKPEYERLSHYYDASTVNFCKCNVDRNRDCAGHFNISAMPTFVVCHGGQVLQTVRGGDLGTVQRQIDMGVALARQHQARASAAGGSGAAARQGAVSAQGNRAEATPLAKAMHRVAQHAPALGGTNTTTAATQPPALQEACAEAVRVLREDAAAARPFGVALMPYLASEAFSPAAAEALLTYLSVRGVSAGGSGGASPSSSSSSPSSAAAAAAAGAAGPHDAALLVNQVLRVVVEAASSAVWTQVALLRLLAQSVQALLQVPSAQPLVAASPFFDHPFLRTGLELERRTVLGALLGVGPLAKSGGAASAAAMSLMAYPNAAEILDMQELVKLFPYADKTGRQQRVYEVQKLSEQLAQINSRLVHAFLACKVTRDAALQFLGKALTLNAGYEKTMHHNLPLSSRYFMSQLQAALLSAALPVVTRNFVPSSVPACYVTDTLVSQGGRAVTTFGKNREEVERVAHFGDERALPTPPAAVAGADGGGYKASTHLFFLAARAVTLVACVMLDEHKRAQQNATHPQSDARQREAYTAIAAVIEGLIGSHALGQARLQFINGLSQWLLHVMGADPATGALPAAPPEAWCCLPQQLVDASIRATVLAKPDPLCLDGTVGLLLVLMGNTLYFPKPHTHALFPTFLLLLLEDPDCRRRLEEHRWFAPHVVRGCINCYIAVEKCPYDKVQVRYNLSHCIHNFLKYPSLCEPVAEEFRQEGTILERFSHMAVADVNEAVDQMIERLRKMNSLVAAGADLSENAVAARNSNNNNDNHNGSSSGGNAAAGPSRGRNNGGGENENEEAEDEEGEEEADDGNMTYHQMGLALRSDILLFKSYMDMFIELSIRFPQGVSQNMVAAQISEMLARSLVAFAGPQMRTLKIENADRYGFKPRDILSRLVDCLTHFRGSTGFVHFLCHGSVPLPDILRAMGIVLQRRLVSETLLWKLGEMRTAVEAQSARARDEEAMWDEAPDYALDMLLSTPLLHPVALPADVKDLDDLVYVNRDTIHHLLLSENKHPYTKEYLDEAMVEAFNARPDVAAHRQKLQEKINAWAAGMRANRATK